MVAGSRLVFTSWTTFSRRNTNSLTIYTQSWPLLSFLLSFSRCESGVSLVFGLLYIVLRNGNDIDPVILERVGWQGIKRNETVKSKEIVATKVLFSLATTEPNFCLILRTDSDADVLLKCLWVALWRTVWDHNGMNGCDESGEQLTTKVRTDCLGLHKGVCGLIWEERVEKKELAPYAHERTRWWWAASFLTQLGVVIWRAS